MRHGTTRTAGGPTRAVRACRRAARASPAAVAQHARDRWAAQLVERRDETPAAADQRSPPRLWGHRRRRQQGATPCPRRESSHACDGSRGDGAGGASTPGNSVRDAMRAVRRAQAAAADQPVRATRSACQAWRLAGYRIEIVTHHPRCLWRKAQRLDRMRERARVRFGESEDPGVRDDLEQVPYAKLRQAIPRLPVKFGMMPRRKRG